MPKHSFISLPKEKQTRILNAALAEFSSHLYHEASINQIIKTAEISRGSFYQYFDEKEDLYFYMINEIVESSATRFIQQTLQKKSIDLFEVYKELLVFTLNLVDDEQYGLFFRNLVLGMSSDFQQKFKLILSRVTQNIMLYQVGFKIKESRYDEAVLKELINVLSLINRDLLEMKIIHHYDDADIMKTYALRMQIIAKPSP